MVPYQSEEGKQALGESYQLGRPNAAFAGGANGEIASGGAMLLGPSGLASRMGELFQFS